MSVLQLKFSLRYSLFSFALLTGFLCASIAQAAVPAVVIDSQQAIGSGYNNPQSIAVSKNGTIFVADSDNNQIVVLTSKLPFPGANAPASTTPYVLTAPKALAILTLLSRSMSGLDKAWRKRACRSSCSASWRSSCRCSRARTQSSAIVT